MFEEQDERRPRIHPNHYGRPNTGSPKITHHLKEEQYPLPLCKATSTVASSWIMLPKAMAAAATEIFKATRSSLWCPWFSAHPASFFATSLGVPHVETLSKTKTMWLWVPSIRQTSMGPWHRVTKGIPIVLLTVSYPSSTPIPHTTPWKTNWRPLRHTIDPTIYPCFCPSMAG